jgi:hypothetical protein
MFFKFFLILNINILKLLNKYLEIINLKPFQMRNSLKNKNKYTLCAKSATLIFFMPFPYHHLSSCKPQKKKKKISILRSIDHVALQGSYGAPMIFSDFNLNFSTQIKKSICTLFYCVITQEKKMFETKVKFWLKIHE